MTPLYILLAFVLGTSTMLLGGAVGVRRERLRQRLSGEQPPGVCACDDKRVFHQRYVARATNAVTYGPCMATRRVRDFVYGGFKRERCACQGYQGSPPIEELVNQNLAALTGPDPILDAVRARLQENA